MSGRLALAVLLAVACLVLSPASTAAAAAAAVATTASGAEPSGRIVVASKNFEESRLLAELFAQAIEAATDLVVERRLNLAGTQVCFEALRTGAVDLYPEYTGTGLASILGEEPAGGATATLNRVRGEFRRRYELVWLAPLGFENAYAVAVPRALAEAEGLASLTDLARVAPRLAAGFGYEFAERPDGLPGLAETYGIRFASVTTLQQALKYQAVAAGDVEVLDVYTTDGRLVTHDLVVLDDDHGFFPPYAAAPLVRADLLARHPEVAAALAPLAGAFDAATMQRLNLRLQEGGEEPAAVARDALVELGLVAAASGGSGLAGAAGWRETESFGRYLWQRRAEIGRRTVEHLGLAGAALALGVLVAVPLGLFLERRRRVAESVIRAIGVTQTVPSLALLAFMIPLFGIGVVPALVALWIYSLFPILRNTYSGLRDADPPAVAAATALGMTPRQVLLLVRLPLAAPIVLAGVRTAAVLTVGTATLAAFIGAGGLGEPIVTGLQLADTRRILSGALPAAALAVAVDLLLAGVERGVRPRGVG